MTETNKGNYDKLIELEKKFAKLATLYTADYMDNVSTDWDHCFKEEEDE